MPKIIRASKTKELLLSEQIINGLRRRSDKKTRAWFTNYVKGSTWIGCKAPVVRDVVKSTVSSRLPMLSSSSSSTSTTTSKTVLKSHNKHNDHDDDDALIFDSAMRLIKCQECDAKLAGMCLLSEHYPINKLATTEILSKLDKEILKPSLYITDWSSADWFAGKVLKRMVFTSTSSEAGEDTVHTKLVKQILNFTSPKNNNDLWHRRCGIVSFIGYRKYRSILPPNFGPLLTTAIEQNLQTSPEERFTQTGCAWALRYMLLEDEEKNDALKMIIRNGSLWNTEAKKSIVEKLNKADPRRSQILSL